MTNPNGNILNFYCELPHHLGIVEIGSALLELDLAVNGICEPPVASVFTHYVSGTPIDSLENDMEDYRRFYITFAPEATREHALEAVGLVFDVLSRLAG